MDHKLMPDKIQEKRIVVWELMYIDARLVNNDIVMPAVMFYDSEIEPVFWSTPFLCTSVYRLSEASLQT